MNIHLHFNHCTPRSIVLQCKPKDKYSFKSMTHAITEVIQQHAQHNLAIHVHTYTPTFCQEHFVVVWVHTVNKVVNKPYFNRNVLYAL